MDTSPIDLAIEAVGSLTELARRLAVEPQLIVNWRKRGIPAKRVLEVERATVMEKNGMPRVTRCKLRSDLYPPEEQVAA